MAPRSKVDVLPEEVRDELGRRLVANGFGGYEELEAWLAERGHRIGKSSLHRWGSRFEDRLGALRQVTEQARVIVSETGDDEGAVNEALIRLVQEKAFSLIMEMKVDPEEVDLPKLIRSIADISRASVNQKKWAKEERRKMAAEAAAKIAAASREAAEAGESGLSAERIEQIKRELAGM